MRVKRYRAEDRATALKQIRAELGADAVIVAENQVRTGGVFGMFGRVEVEILAALEERPPAPRAPATAPRPASPSPGATGRPAEVEATISPAARRAAANAVAPVSGTMDGPGRLAAILEQLPRTGGGVSPEMTSRLADLLASGGATSSPGRASGGALAGAPRVAPPVAPPPASTRGGAIVPGSAAGGERVTPPGPVAPPSPVRPVPAAPARNQPTQALAATGSGGTPAVGGPGAAIGTPALPADPDPSPAVGSPPLDDATGAPTVFRDMQHTLSDLRASVDRLMRQQQTQLWPRDLPVVRTIYQHLIAQELDPSLSLEVAGQVSDEVNEGRGTDAAVVMARVRELISERIKVGRVAPATNGPTVVVLVGPTGVGKTTTLAKLAAHLSMQENRRVALVTTDTFRIAAASQLGTYADLMELPLEVAYSPEELRAAVERQWDADFILVDSPGCAQRNDAQIRELGAFVEALPGATVLLTVAATVKLRDLIDIQEGFGSLPLGGFVLTKLDETTTFGPVMSLVARGAAKELPVYYVTSGQNVPTDLEEATLDGLADLVVGRLLERAVTGLVVPVGARVAPTRELVGVGDAR